MLFLLGKVKNYQYKPILFCPKSPKITKKEGICLKNLHMSKICSTFAASKVKRPQKLINMEAAVRQNPVFNPMQIHLLQMFSLDKEENGLIELKDVLYNYYSNKMKNRLNELWDNGVLDQARLDEINQMDLHQLD